MSQISSFKKELESLANPKKVEAYQRFFKTGKGQYGEGDVFLGISVPKQRLIAKKYKDLSFDDCVKLLNSMIHEHRMIALFILVQKYKKGDKKTKRKIVSIYLKNRRGVNNWDLVDLSAHKILGHFLIDKDRKTLYKLAKSKSLWDRRIAVISCFAFIKDKDFEDALKISELLLKDKHDLIHKAVGWMLREIGKKDQGILEGFLLLHHKEMPRTMLRYSLEKLSEKKRKFYMQR